MSSLVFLSYFLRDKNLSGHAIVFIKTEEGKDFIFDPNRATLAVDPAQSAARLVEITRSIRFSSLAFVPIGLDVLKRLAL